MITEKALESTSMEFVHPVSRMSTMLNQKVMIIQNYVIYVRILKQVRDYQIFGGYYMLRFLGQETCSADYDNRYYNNNGSIACLIDGTADIAFVEIVKNRERGGSKKYEKIKFFITSIIYRG